MVVNSLSNHYPAQQRTGNNASTEHYAYAKHTTQNTYTPTCGEAMYRGSSDKHVVNTRKVTFRRKDLLSQVNHILQIEKENSNNVSTGENANTYKSSSKTKLYKGD